MAWAVCRLCAVLTPPSSLVLPGTRVCVRAQLEVGSRRWGVGAMGWGQAAVLCPDRPTHFRAPGLSLAPVHPVSGLPHTPQTHIVLLLRAPARPGSQPVPTFRCPRLPARPLPTWARARPRQCNPGQNSPNWRVFGQIRRWRVRGPCVWGQTVHREAALLTPQRPHALQPHPPPSRRSCGPCP